MTLKLQTIINWIEEFAPKVMAEEWDNVGLQIGDPAANVKNVMVTLDVNNEVVQEAIDKKVDLIISHHPLIFKPVKNIRYDLPTGKVISKLIANNISLYVAHTNLDSVKGGINCILAQKLGLEKIEVLSPSYQEKLCKIVVFVPEGYEDKVRDAISKAGAGWIGNYSHCTYQINGKGTFKPREGSDPFIGEVGEMEVVDEKRVETILPQKIVGKVIKAMIKAHPYEEAAYDLVPLLNEGEKTGLGRVGYLSEPLELKAFIEKVKDALNISTIKVGGDLDTKVKKIALCGGSGASILNKAAFKGADVFVTGDIKYHEGQNMLDLGMNFIDAGHNATEKIIVPVLDQFLHEKVEQEKAQLNINQSEINTDPFVYY